MTGGQSAIDSAPSSEGDRLPWLEPYRDPAAKSATSPAPVKSGIGLAPKRRRSGGLIMAGVTALALGAGGYWFGRVSAPPRTVATQSTVIATLPPSRTVTSLLPGPLPYRALDDQPAEPIVTGGEQAGIEASVRTAPMMHRRSVHVGRAVPRPAATSQTDQTDRRNLPPPPPPPPPLPRKMQTNAPPVTAIHPPVPVRAPASRPPVKVGQPGEVIELGVFISPRTARAALHRVVRRYPYLGTRPRVVLPQSANAGWPAVYRLRLGTGSGRNARILCRYVHSIGQRCAVV